MTRTRRWCVVAVGLLVLIGLPVVVRLLPVRGVDATAPELLARAQAARTGYSGEVQTEGSLALPVSDQFTDVADLFGGRTTLRVWWRSADDFRVDKLTTTGETDLFQDRLGLTTWNYEADRAVRTLNARVRLPRTADLLPPTLALRLLGDATPEQVSRLDTARVAGISAPGLRLVPRDARSSIAHVDVWVDPASGLPLRVSVFGRDSDVAALTSSFVDVSIATPPARYTRFTLPAGAERRFENVADIAAAANRFAPLAAPARLAGMTRHSSGVGAVGVYGDALTSIVAIPLWQPAADPLRHQLATTPGSFADARGLGLGVGLLNLRLSKTGFAGHSWLLVGTVTPATLSDAARELSSLAPILRKGAVDGFRRP
jgi:hypothetical protein